MPDRIDLIGLLALGRSLEGQHRPGRAFVDPLVDTGADVPLVCGQDIMALQAGRAGVLLAGFPFVADDGESQVGTQKLAAVVPAQGPVPPI